MIVYQSPRSSRPLRISSFEKKPESGGRPASASEPMRKQGVGERQRLAQAAHPVDVLDAAHRADHRAGRHEEHRLEEGVRHEVEDAGGVGAGRDGDHHVADLAHGRVGDDPLQVGLDDRHRRGHHQGEGADDHADARGDVAQLEERVQARDEVDACGHHRGRVDERRHRRRALHGVREPGVERELSRLRERADEDQDEAPGEVVRVAGEGTLRAGEQLEVIHGAGVAEAAGTSRARCRRRPRR